MKKGFSLIEVLVFVTILSLFFVAAMAVATYSLKQLKYNQHKIIAAHYAEQMTEWVKSEKEADWDQFINHDSMPGMATYCVNTAVLDWNNSDSCGGTFTYDGIFDREIELSAQPDSPAVPDRVEVSSNVYWKEGNQVFSVKIKTLLKVLE